MGSQASDEVGGYGRGGTPERQLRGAKPKLGQWGSANAGAVTWCGGTTGCTGAVTPANSLVGSQARPGRHVRRTVLTNGNYVVHSYWWANGAAANAGAVTWCNGTTGCTGPVTPANSLVGTLANDQVGYGGVTRLTNGNYVVVSLNWNSGAATKVGAATWCNGTIGCTGAVSAANSLVGSTTNDQVGFNGAVALTNGNYVVDSMFWDNGTVANAGAVTWCSGASGRIGSVSHLNSLVGSTANDQVGNSGVRGLTNGDYVVSSSNWVNGSAAKAGAATRCSGTSGCIGPVSAANSLVGSNTNDKVGGYIAVALPNSSYVVKSPDWANGSTVRAGAVTWCSGTSNCTGVVTPVNSLVGSQANDQIGDYVTLLNNGSYVVSNLMWDNGAAANAGAVTWCSGTSGCSGVVSAANSLVGSSAGDMVGNGWAGVWVFSNSTYIVQSPSWDNGGTVDSGAVTWGNGAVGTPTGTITDQNSVLGTAVSGGTAMNIAYDELYGRLFVGRPADNKVTLINMTSRTYLPFVHR